MPVNDPLDRRDFLKKASVTGLGAFAASRGIGPLFAFEGSPAEKISVAVMGLNGRGMVHVKGFATNPNSTVSYLCDVDSKVLAKAASDAAKWQPTPPKTVTDFRRILDDKSVDVLAIAAPDHWH